MELELTIGQQLRTIRKARGLTLKWLAVRLGLDVSYVSRVECDLLQPARRYIGDWASLLGVDADALFYAFGYIPPDLKEKLATSAGHRRDVRQLLAGDA